MAVHVSRTGSMRFAKFGLFLTSAYFVTLFLIIKCIPTYTSDAGAALVGTRTNGSLREATHISKNPYALTWIKEKRVIFKRVRGVKKVLNEDFVDQDDEIVDCQTGDYGSRFRKVHDSVYSYSAFYDQRTGEAVVRVLAIVRKGFTDSNPAPFWCHFPTYDERSVLSYTSTKLQFYEMCENHKREFGGWILTCNVPINITQLSEGVLIGYGDSEKESISESRHICVKSRNARVTRRKLKYGVCVPPLYGNITPKALLEFVEFHRIVGADIFTVYVELSNDKEGISKEIESVLKYYESRNIMTVIRWQLPVKPKYIWYHGQSLAINDCLYRNMDGFEHLAFIDVDEFLVPHGNHTTLDDVIDDISKAHPLDFPNASGFIFKSTLYSDKFSRTVDTEEIKPNVLTNRTKGFSFFRNKAMVRPERMFEMGIHHISRSWPDRANYGVVKVNTVTAHVHHYRKCVHEFGVHCESWIEDRTVPIKYGKAMVDNYLKTMYDITP